MSQTSVKTVSLPKSGTTVFYREQGPGHEARTILLLHGFPSSSFGFRYLIPLLATKYRVLAPDMPGFGFTEVPNDYKYSFDALADTISEFLDSLSIYKFSVYIFDYGAPVGLRIALKRPSAIENIVSQNGNAYLAGLGKPWDALREYWASGGTPEARSKLASVMLSFERTKFVYENGTAKDKRIAPEAYYLDYYLLQRHGMRDIHLDLLMDYQDNVATYGKFQEYFRSSQVPLLAIWGKNDISFIPPGAEAFKTDLPEAAVRLIDAGHFAAESEPDLIANEIIKFIK